MRIRRLVAVAAVSAIALFATTGTSYANSWHPGDGNQRDHGGYFGDDHHGPHMHGTTCSNGSIAPGTYSSITVTGFCALDPGTFTVYGGVFLAPNAGLDGSNCDSHITIGGGVRVAPGALLFLGGSVNGTGCAADTNDVVNGGVYAFQSLGVVVHGTTINGGFSVLGGGGGTSCENVPNLPFPPFTDVEDSAINGGAVIAGMNTCWMGFIRVAVNGSVHIDFNTMGDPDSIEIGLNTINGNLGCIGNQIDPAIGGPGGVPTNSFDGSPPNPNVVSGKEFGQCKGL